MDSDSDYGGADYGGHAGDGVGEVGSVADSSIGADAGYSYGGFAGDGVGEVGSVADASVADASIAGVSTGHEDLGAGFAGLSHTGYNVSAQDSAGFPSVLASNFSTKGFATAAVMGGPALAAYAARGVVGALVDGLSAAFASIGSPSASGPSGSAGRSGPSVGAGGGDAVFSGSPKQPAPGFFGSAVLGYSNAKPSPSANSPLASMGGKPFQPQTSVSPGGSGGGGGSLLALLAIAAAVAGFAS